MKKVEIFNKILFMILWGLMLTIVLVFELVHPTSMLLTILSLVFVFAVGLVFYFIYKHYQKNKKLVEKAKAEYLQNTKPKPLKMYGYYEPEIKQISKFSEYQDETKKQNIFEDEITM